MEHNSEKHLPYFCTMHNISQLIKLNYRILQSGGMGEEEFLLEMVKIYSNLTEEDKEALAYFEKRRIESPESMASGLYSAEVDRIEKTCL